MSSTKVLLRNKKQKDGKYPLAIRITKSRKSTFIHLGHKIEKAKWDPIKQRVKNSHPNAARLNNYILKRLADVSNDLLDMEIEEKDVSIQAIKDNLKQSVNGSGFFALADTYIENLKKSGKYNQASSDKPRIERFSEFLKGADIDFKNITVPMLNSFKAHLKATRNISERTIVNHLVVFRTIFNLAINGGLVDPKHYPFGRNKIKIKFPESVKIGLNEEEVKRMETFELEPGSSLDHARNVWLFSFYFAGMRISDVLRLRWSDFKDDRLYYSMGKNTKAGSLKIPNKASKIIQKYESGRRSKDDLIFQELKVMDDLNNSYVVQLKIANAIKLINKSLREVAKLMGLEKKLTMHIARHTFGNISGDKISIQMLQKLYRHSSITTTIGYQGNFIHKNADDALDAVVGF